MLDVMRRNIKSLAVTLWAVIGAFILFIFVDWGMGRGDPTSGKSVLATINDEPIYADAYRDEFLSQMRRMQEMFRERWNNQMVRQMGLERSVIERLISQEVIVQEAEKLGIRVSDAELHDAIVSNPSFQEDGKFIGRERYQRLLLMNHKTWTQFEAELRRDLVVTKLRAAVTLPLSVSDKDVREAYYSGHEKVKISYLYVKSSPEAMEIPDVELRQYFEQNRTRFDLPERRKGRYVLLDIDRLKQQVNLTPKDIEEYYKDNEAQFTVEEQVDAQKIVVKWEKRGGKDASRKAADKVIEEARAGGDFGKLARESSDDPNASAGGVTGPIFKGGLSEAEEAVVFNQPEGAVTAPIETEDAWVIYKVTKKTPAHTRPLQEAEQQIRSILSWRKAREAMDKKTAEILAKAQKDKTLDKVAQQNGLTVKDSQLLAKGDEVEGLGDAGQLSQSLFAANQGEISGPLHVGSGSVLYSVVSIEPPRPAKLEEVAEKVKKALSALRRKEQAAAQAQAALDEIQAGAKPEDVARRMAAEVKEHEFARNSYIPDIGSSSYIDEKAFSMDSDSPWTGPVTVKEGACIFKVVQKTPVGAEEFEKEKESYRQNLLEEKRNGFFDSYVQLLKKKRNINIDAELLSAVNEAILGQVR